MRRKDESLVVGIFPFVLSIRTRTDSQNSYKMHNQGDYDTELERRFREFVKTLDIDDDHVARQFRRLVDVSSLPVFKEGKIQY